MTVTRKVIEELDLLVECVDYEGGAENDVRLANKVCEYWPEIEPLLRAAIAEGCNA